MFADAACRAKFVGWLTLLLAPLVAGCESTEIPVVRHVPDPAKTVAPPPVPVRKPSEPEFAFRLAAPTGEPVSVARLYVRVVALSDGRPAALHIASYAEAANEQFPSLMFYAVVPQRSLSELVGQVVEAKVYFQATPRDAPWESSEQHPVQVQVLTLASGTMTGRIVQGSLQNVVSGEVMELSGPWQAGI